MTTQAGPNSPTPEPAMVEVTQADRALLAAFYRNGGLSGLPNSTDEFRARSAESGALDGNDDIDLVAFVRHSLAAIPTDRPIAGDGEVDRFTRGCGYTCPFRDVVSGVCERHGPTAADQVVQRVTDGFKRDLRAILRSDK
ncbi:MAG: hypothetical protein JWR85_3605 [Marmoricola sp.]|nr:hypothetical protein [Marmoricola sp.]